MNILQIADPEIRLTIFDQVKMISRVIARELIQERAHQLAKEQDK